MSIFFKRDRDCLMHPLSVIFESRLVLVTWVPTFPNHDKINVSSDPFHYCESLENWFCHESDLLNPIDFGHESLDCDWLLSWLGNFDTQVTKNNSEGGISGYIVWALPPESFPDLFLIVSMYQLESWYIHSTGCTQVHVSPESIPCDQRHILSLGIGN